MQKRILFLGASEDQLPAIEYAKEQNHYVITCDSQRDRPGHQLADEFYIVSTVDKEAVLSLAKTLNLDAVLAFGADSGAPTQAYVGNELGLPSNPYESILILTRKDLLRAFMKDHGFYTPVSKGYSEYEAAASDIARFKFPVLVKPVDSSGANGITKLDTPEALEPAFETALFFSRSKKVLIEEFFNYEGHIVDGDGFIVDGKIAFHCCGDSPRDPKGNPLVLVGINIPSTLTKEKIHHATSEIQRLLSLLKIEQGPFNAEFAFDKEGNFLLLDFGPRNGGGSLPVVIRNATGVYLTKYTVDAALGLDCSLLKMKEPEGFFSDHLVHTVKDGVFDHIWYSDEIKKNIIKQSITAKPGDQVQRLDRVANRIGIILLQFSSLEEMHEKTHNMDKYMKVQLK